MKTSFKKIITVILAFVIFIASTGSAFARHGGDYYNRYRPPHHHRHHSYYHDHGNNDSIWALLGIGLIAGGLIGYAASLPPSNPVGYSVSEPVNEPPTYGGIKEQRYLPPLEVPQPSRVLVTALELNVRVGPGFNHPVAGYVVKGESLEVLGSALGWLFVRTPSGLNGWVMVSFTSPLPTPAG